jgi:hypothetical protein
MSPEPVQDTDPTIGKLVVDASRDISNLISKEIELAKSELKVSFKHGGTGIGLFAGAAFLALLAIIMLSVSLPSARSPRAGRSPRRSRARPTPPPASLLARSGEPAAPPHVRTVAHAPLSALSARRCRCRRGGPR